MAKKSVTILFLTASMSVTGTHRILLDLIKGLKKDNYRILIAYKPHLNGPGNDLVREAEEIAQNIFPLRGRHLFDGHGLLDLYKIFKKYDIDIVHCWDSFTIIARLIGKIISVKVIDSIGNPPARESWKNRLAKRVTSLFLDGAIFQSRESMKAHHEHGSNILKFCSKRVIYNCIDINEIPRYSADDRTLFRSRYNLSIDDILLTNLGMYNEQKAQEYLIQALPRVLEQNKNIKLILVGWGSREANLRNYIKKLNLMDHVVLTGKKQRQEVFKLLSVTDIYVSSSLWEGLPIAVLEAMAFNLPVVATDVIGNREVVIDSKNGILVPVKDPIAMGSGILHLLDNPKLKKDMGVQGRKMVEDLFTKERFIKEHEVFYRSIID
ncbi:glycosyltransferase [Thermodesulfobacteriota bacterium]